MIKINLHPQKRRAQAEGSQRWLVVILLLVTLEAIGLFVFHATKQEELESQERKNKELSSQIAQSKALVQNHNDVTGKLKDLRAREDAISKLQSARTGPTAVLLELARLLTPGRGPSVDPDHIAQLRRENPLQVYNPNWDGRRVWLESFKEKGLKVALKGLARDAEDVSELARRMDLSNYFYEVKIRKGKRSASMVKFELRARVRY